MSPKEGETVADLVQRRVCKYGDDSGCILLLDCKLFHCYFFQSQKRGKERIRRRRKLNILSSQRVIFQAARECYFKQPASDISSGQ